MSLPNGKEDADDNCNKRDNIIPPINDGYLNMEVGLPCGKDNNLMHTIVKRQKVDENGFQVGMYHNNPLLDTRAYEVEFNNGTIEILTANIIAKNLLAQVDEEGHRQLLLDEIINHHTDTTAIRKKNGFIQTPHGNKRRELTTRGWELCIMWKGGSTNWIALKDLKICTLLS